MQYEAMLPIAVESQAQKYPAIIVLESASESMMHVNASATESASETGGREEELHP